MDYFLARLPIFKHLPAGELARLSDALHLRSYPKGEEIFREVDPPESVYLLKSGLVKAVKYSPREEPVIMEIIVPGGLFGMIAVLEKKAYPVSAVCIQESEAYRIGVADFDDLMKRNPNFSQAVYSEIGRHLRHSQALRALAKEPAERRIMYILWMLSGSVGKDLPILRGDLAEMAGTSEETSIRTLADLRKKKLVTTRWKRITVIKPERLKALSESR